MELVPSPAMLMVPGSTYPAQPEVPKPSHGPLAVLAPKPLAWGSLPPCLQGESRAEVKG
jgi:hypothetical protein